MAEVALLSSVLTLVLVGVILFVLALVVLSFAHGVRTPILARFAIRNMVRRKKRMLVVIGGLMIGTAIIASALVVGDNLEFIFVDNVYTELHNVDEYVAREIGGGFGPPILAPFPESGFELVRDSLENQSTPVDGVAPALFITMPVQNLNSSQASPSVLEGGSPLPSTRTTTTSSNCSRRADSIAARPLLRYSLPEFLACTDIGNSAMRTGSPAAAATARSVVTAANTTASGRMHTPRFSRNRSRAGQDPETAINLRRPGQARPLGGSRPPAAGAR